MNKRRREQIKKIVEACGWKHVVDCDGDIHLLFEGAPLYPPFNPFGYDGDLAAVLDTLNVTVIQYRRVKDHGFDFVEIHRDGDRQTHCATGDGYHEAVCKAILKMLRSTVEMRMARAGIRRAKA